jgi:integrase
MSVYKRWKGERIKSSHPKYKQAKWCCEFFLDGKTFKKSVPDARNQREAEDFERDWRRAIRGSGEAVFIDETNFADFVDSTYLLYARNNNPAYQTKVFETNVLKRYFGDYRLKAITPELIEEFKTSRLKERVRCQKCAHGRKHVCAGRPITPSTVNRELTTLGKILSLAVRNKKIADNPKRFVPQLPEPDPRERFLTRDEKQKLFVELQGNEQLLAIVTLAILTGWRRGQILSLRKSSLDEMTLCVTIAKSKRTKARKIPVSSIVWKILNGLARKTEDYLFVNKRTGKQLLDFGRSWDTVCSDAGITGLRFHDLRRTFAVEMLNQNAGEFMIQTALGHSEIQTTRIYAQVQNEGLRESLERLAGGENFYHSAIIQPPDDFEN